MSFISYAQNFEDVMLWRALRHIAQGFYIDAGAWSPEADSVTKAFYERGWRGINVEPQPAYFQALQEQRPGDINLGVALGAHAGRSKMAIFDNTGLSTLDSDIAERHKKEGFFVEYQEVQLSTLDGICKKHLYQGQPVHFLKVDVEGYEAKVLEGNDWETWRPWIVLIEATHPMSQVESFHEGGAILKEADYTFCYADGLNRFYVANEHPELVTAFQFPPNFFDDFETAEKRGLAEQVAQMEGVQRELIKKQQELESARNEAAEQRGRVEALQAQLKENNEALLGLRREADEQSTRGDNFKEIIDDKDLLIRELQDTIQAWSQALVQEKKASHWLEKGWNESRPNAAELEEAVHHWQQTAENLQGQLQDVLASKSWRITLPLRKAMLLFRCLMRGAVQIGLVLINLPRTLLGLTRRLTLRVIKKTSDYVEGQPRLREKIAHGLNHFPGLKARLQSWIKEDRLGGISPERMEGEQTLPEPARKVYCHLKSALNRHHKG